MPEVEQFHSKSYTDVGDLKDSSDATKLSHVSYMISMVVLEIAFWFKDIMVSELEDCLEGRIASVTRGSSNISTAHYDRSLWTRDLLQIERCQLVHYNSSGRCRNMVHRNQEG